MQAGAHGRAWVHAHANASNRLGPPLARRAPHGLLRLPWPASRATPISQVHIGQQRQHGCLLELAFSTTRCRIWRGIIAAARRRRRRRRREADARPTVGLHRPCRWPHRAVPSPWSLLTGALSEAVRGGGSLESGIPLRGGARRRRAGRRRWRRSGETGPSHSGGTRRPAASHLLHRRCRAGFWAGRGPRAGGRWRPLGARVLPLVPAGLQAGECGRHTDEDQRRRLRPFEGRVVLSCRLRPRHTRRYTLQRP